MENDQKTELDVDKTDITNLSEKNANLQKKIDQLNNDVIQRDNSIQKILEENQSLKKTLQEIKNDISSELSRILNKSELESSVTRSKIMGFREKYNI